MPAPLAQAVAIGALHGLVFAQVLAAVMHWHRSGPSRDDATAASATDDNIRCAAVQNMISRQAFPLATCGNAAEQALLQMVRFPLLSVAALQGMEHGPKQLTS